MAAKPERTERRDRGLTKLERLMTMRFPDPLDECVRCGSQWLVQEPEASHCRMCGSIYYLEGNLRKQELYETACRINSQD
jgi:hypothetical protein